MRARRARRPEHLRRQSVEVDSGREDLHEVTVAGCPKLKTPEPDHNARRKRVRYAYHLEIKREQKMIVTQRAPTWRANCRCPDLAV